ncbi:MAG: metal-sulfur cluster assembly factor [Gemmatimonadales bacterium]|jgi:metal-sulfur cluster biosynthetic enzyme|nr:metal-sulfur cluster assembly factor [Gemmatimonadales bacterium]
MMPTEAELLEALNAVQDPELGIGIVDLGLIYDVAVEGDVVRLTMTFTAEGCPMGDAIEAGVRRVVGALPGVREVALQLTFTPPWRPDFIDLAALDALRGDRPHAL